MFPAYSTFVVVLRIRLFSTRNYYFSDRWMHYNTLRHAFLIDHIHLENQTKKDVEWENFVIVIPVVLSFLLKRISN